MHARNRKSTGGVRYEAQAQRGRIVFEEDATDTETLVGPRSEDSTRFSVNNRFVTAEDTDTETLVGPETRRSEDSTWSYATDTETLVGPETPRSKYSTSVSAKNRFVTADDTDTETLVGPETRRSEGSTWSYATDTETLVGPKTPRSEDSSWTYVNNRNNYVNNATDTETLVGPKTPRSEGSTCVDFDKLIKARNRESTTTQAPLSSSSSNSSFSSLSSSSSAASFTLYDLKISKKIQRSPVGPPPEAQKHPRKLFSRNLLGNYIEFHLFETETTMWIEVENETLTIEKVHIREFGVDIKSFYDPAFLGFLMRMYTAEDIKLPPPLQRSKSDLSTGSEDTGSEMSMSFRSSSVSSPRVRSSKPPVPVPPRTNKAKTGPVYTSPYAYKPADRLQDMPRKKSPPVGTGTARPGEGKSVPIWPRTAPPRIAPAVLHRIFTINIPKKPMEQKAVIYPKPQKGRIDVFHDPEDYVFPTLLDLQKLSQHYFGISKDPAVCPEERRMTERLIQRVEEARDLFELRRDPEDDASNRNIRSPLDIRPRENWTNTMDTVLFLSIPILLCVTFFYIWISPEPMEAFLHLSGLYVFVLLATIAYVWY